MMDMETGKYLVLTFNNGEGVRLFCDTLADAIRLKTAVIKYGKYQNVMIKKIRK